MTNPHKLTVLFLEDSEDDALLLVRELKRAGYEPVFERVETERDMRDALERRKWDLIISDYNMPGFSGLAALEVYNESGLDIPFIIVSGAIGEETAAELMVSGAHDYVMKDNLARLVPAVQRELKETRLRKAQKRAAKELVLTESRQKVLLRLYQMTDTPLDGIIDFVVEECQRISESELAFVGFINKDETLMDTYLCSNQAMEQCAVDKKPAVFPIRNAGLWSEVVRQKKIIIANNYEDPNPYKKGCPEGHVPLSRFMGVPVIDGDRVVLVAGLANKKDPYSKFDATHTRLLLEGMWNCIRRTNAERELKRSLAFQQQLIDSLPLPVYYKGTGGWYLGCNKAFEKFFGKKQEEIVGKTARDIFPRHVADAYREKDLKLLDNHEIQAYESTVKDAAGDLHNVIFNKALFHTIDGSTGGLIGTLIDITSLKKAEEELQASTRKLRENLIGTIQVISMMLEARDPYTAGHQRRVSALARSIAQEMGLSKDVIDNIRMAGIIHDIGKMSVPTEILAKPGMLSNIEMQLMKVHPQTGYDILKVVDLPAAVADAVLQHHERLDGSGYPQGLRGDQILLEAKILAVADVVEAMASHRPYRPSIGLDAALEKIEKNKGILYDTDVTGQCLKLFREKGFRFE